MTTQTPHEARRETIARIVDPDAFAAFDNLIHVVNDGQYADGEPVLSHEAEAILEDASGLIKSALAKADAILADDPALVLVEMAKKALIEALALYDVATQAATFTRPRTGQVIVNVKRAETVMAQLRPAIVALAAYQSTDKGDAE